MTYEITDAVNNKPIAPISSFLGMSYKFEAKDTRYPVEKGGFFSANKVVSPWSIPVQVAITGSPERLRNILFVIQRYAAGVELVNVTTPFYTYLDGNIESLNYTLKEGGAVGLLELELGLVEIRQIEARYTSISVSPVGGSSKPISADKAKNKSDASTEEKGKQQPKPPRQSILGGWSK
ncbi:phage baseplate protein [Pseudomonas sp. NPDC098747]|uniref:phage baseplate protein n=1 Tax=Pseudomonas sp. NPDC098747 TaxID=3364487 RepID=UPI00383BDD3A